MNVILDVNIVLDYFNRRDPFYNTTCAAIEKLERNGDRCYISCFSISTIYYFIRKHSHSNADALNTMEKISVCYELVGSDSKDVFNSLDSKILDYEDALVESSAIKINADYILTRDVKDFAKSKVKAIDPYHFLKLQ